MKFRLFTKTFCLLFVLFFLQTAFAQNPANTNYFLIKNGDYGNAAAARPRIYEDAKKSAAEEASGGIERKAVKVLDLERRAFDLINQKRAEAKLLPLVWNEDLARAARVHSANMAANHFFSHTGLDGKLVSNRADDAGVKTWRLIGENIAYNHGFGDPTACAVANWMNSPGHRDNILKTDWRESAVGVAVTENGTYYFTQVFLLKK